MDKDRNSYSLFPKDMVVKVIELHKKKAVKYLLD